MSSQRNSVKLGLYKLDWDEFYPSFYEKENTFQSIITFLVETASKFCRSIYFSVEIWKSSNRKFRA